MSIDNMAFRRENASAMTPLDLRPRTNIFDQTSQFDTPALPAKRRMTGSEIREFTGASRQHADHISETRVDLGRLGIISFFDNVTQDCSSSPVSTYNFSDFPDISDESDPREGLVDALKNYPVAVVVSIGKGMNMPDIWTDTIRSFSEKYSDLATVIRADVENSTTGCIVYIHGELLFATDLVQRQDAFIPVCTPSAELAIILENVMTDFSFLSKLVRIRDTVRGKTDGALETVKVIIPPNKPISRRNIDISDMFLQRGWGSADIKRP